MEILDFILNAMNNGFDGVIPQEVYEFMQSIDFNLDNLFGSDYSNDQPISPSEGTNGGDSSSIKNG